LSNETKNSFKNIEESIERTNEKRQISDRQLVDYAPSQAEGYFTNLRNWINDECVSSKDIIDNIYDLGDTTSKSLLDGYKDEIKQINENSQEISTGVIGQDAASDDRLRTEYISALLKKSVELLPLVDKLYAIRKNVGDAYDVLKQSNMS